MTTARTWETNADEFAALDKGEGWPFAVLVASAVGRGTVGGNNGNQHTGGIRQMPNGKVSAVAFAGRAGTDDKRVTRYLDAWDKAAKAGVVPDASTLTPGTTWDIPFPSIKFERYYTSGVGQTLTDDRRERLMEAGRAEGMRSGAKVADVAANPKALAAAIKADPATAAVARRALTPTPTKAEQVHVVREALKDPVVAREVVEDKSTRTSVTKAAIEREHDTAAKRRITESPEATQNRAEIGWMNTLKHDTFALDELRMFARELPTYGTLNEQQRLRTEHIVEQVENAVEFIKSALLGGDIDSELAALLAGGA